jgi:tetratricopeptide (TPR) repeat protein
MVIGDDDAALAMLRAAVDLEHPEADSLRMLADLDYQAERYADAQKLYELGAKTWRDDLQWTKALARVLIKTGDRQRLFEVLARLAMYDADDLLMRKKLAHLALEDKNYEQAARWALDTIYVNVEDADAHRVLGEALAGQKKWLAAADEYQTAVGLDDKQPEWQLALAEAYAQAGETAKARTTLIELIKKFPQFPDAAARLEALKDK